MKYYGQIVLLMIARSMKLGMQFGTAIRSIFGYRDIADTCCFGDMVTLLDMAFFDKGLGKEKSVVRKDSTGMSFGSDGWADWPFFLGLKTRPGLAYAASSAV